MPKENRKVYGICRREVHEREGDQIYHGIAMVGMYGMFFPQVVIWSTI